MRYIFEAFDQTGCRLDTTTKLKEAEKYMHDSGGYIEVTDGMNLDKGVIVRLETKDAVDEWCEVSARNFSWSDSSSKVHQIEQFDKLKRASKTWDPFNEEETGIRIQNNESMPSGVSKKGQIKAQNVYVKKVLGGLFESIRNPITFKEEKRDAVNPSHYKGYVEDMQWLDCMSKIPTLRHPERFKAALELQVRKYLDRNEQKDDSLQEFKKALFYLKYLIMYIENGNNPISAEDVHKSLGN